MTASNSAIFARDTIEDDDRLLLAFCESRDQAAFAELVRRHIHLVHGTAARSLGDDRAMADDVTQAVFTILAKKASHIRARAVLPSWLHQTTLYAVANAKKSAARRRYHERQAAMQNPEVDMTNTSERHAESADQLALLDQAIASLSVQDKSAILARYFEGATTTEIALRQNSSAPAIQKRLERAIDKLRAFFITQKVNATTTSIGAVLADGAMHKAPAALIESISTASLAGAASASVAGITKGTLAMMNWIKLQFAAMVTAGMIATAGVGVGIAQVASNQPANTQPTTSPTSEVLIGTWKMIDGAKKGKPVRATVDPETLAIFTDTEVSITSNGSGEESTKYTLDATATPPHIDMSNNAIPPRMILGIYELKGNILRLYFDGPNKPRPTKIPDDPKTVTGTLMILERSDEARPAQSVLDLRRTAAVMRAKAYVGRLIVHELQQRRMPPANHVVLGGDNQPLVSPFSRDGKPGYVYLGDESVVSSRIPKADTVILAYDEASKADVDSPNAGVAVGFADGHAEWVLMKDFPAMLKASEEALQVAKTN